MWIVIDHHLSVFWAVSNDCIATLRRFLAIDAKMNNTQTSALINDTRISRTWFYRMLSYGKQDDNRALHGSDWCLAQRVQFTPLALAAMFGFDRMVEFLLDQGADIDKPARALCYCWPQNYQSYLSMQPTHHHGLPPCMTCQEMGGEEGWCKTPLHIAVCYGHKSITKLLLSRGAKPPHVCPRETWLWSFPQDVIRASL